MPARRTSKVVSLIALAQTGNESLTRQQAFDVRLDHTFALFLFGLRLICLMQVPLTLLGQSGRHRTPYDNPYRNFNNNCGAASADREVGLTYEEKNTPTGRSASANLAFAPPARI